MNKVGKYRWVILALLFFAAVVNYMDRQVFAILKPDLSKRFNLNDEDYGNIIAAFQAAYAIGQASFGPILEWLGTKSAYAFAVVFWSLAAMSHTLARSAFGFGAARFALGIGESGNFPAAIRTVTEWFPQRERSVATGLFNSGTNLGAIIAPLLVGGVLYPYFGWKGAFIALALADFIWLGFWLIFYDPLEKSKRVDAEERAYIQSGKTGGAQEKLPLSKLFGFRQSWAYWATCILVGPVWWFYLFWLPDIFSKQFHLDIRNFGPPLAVIYTVAAIGSIGGGGLSAWFLRRGWSVNAARKSAALICALSALPVILIPHIKDFWAATGLPLAASVWVATGILALANAAHQGWSATMYTTVSDIFPKNGVGTVVGLGGAIAAVASMTFAHYVGVILQATGSYTIILTLCGGAYVLALAIFHVIVPRMDPVRIE